MGSINILIIGMLFVGFSLEQKKLNEMVVDENHPGIMAVHDTIDVPDKDAIPDYSQAYHDVPLAYEDRGYQTIDKTEMIVGEYGETEDYDATIALVGSSTTLHWQGALLEAAKKHNYRVLTIIRFSTRLSTEYPEDTPEGIWNRSVLNYLKDSDVDLVITQASFANVEDDKNQKHVINQLQHIKNKFDIDVLALRDVPRYNFNVLESIESYGYDETVIKMNEEENQKDKDAWNDFEIKFASINKLDLSDYFIIDNKFVPIIGNVLVYRDNRHLTNTLSKSFGPIFEKEITSILEKNN